MAAEHKVADGHNNAAGFALVSPQGELSNILHPVRNAAVSGDVYDDGSPYVEHRYNELSPAQLASLETQYGVASANTNDVTVSILSNTARTTYASYNGKVVKPVYEFRNQRYYNVVFTIKELIAI